jgi:chromosome segregation ATPase
MKNEINHFESILEEKETYLISLKYEKNKLVDHYRKVADDQKKKFREENLSLEKQMNKNKEDLLFVEKEMGELTRKKNDIENEVELKSNVIRKRDKEIVEKEREVWDAIEESNRLRLKLDTLQQQHSETMVEDKEMSKKIEILEDELVEKENTIMNLRKKNTMTREEIEEELGKITKGQEKKLDDQTAMIKQQNEKIDFLADTLMKVLKSQEKK